MDKVPTDELYLLVHAIRTVAREMHEHLPDDVGVKSKVSGLVYLHMLLSVDAMRQKSGSDPMYSQLGEHVKSATWYSLVRNLVDAGLLVSYESYNDETERYCKRLHLSDDGRALVAKVQKIFADDWARWKGLLKQAVVDAEPVT